MTISAFLELISYKPDLSHKDIRIFKIFNIMLLVATVVVICIGFFLFTLGLMFEFFVCIGEAIVFLSLLWMHIKGRFLITRYIFFVFAIAMQVYGSLFHGENGGYDFLFLTTALTPVLFFDKPAHYFSLFLLSIATFIAVKFLYDVVDPVFPFEDKFFIPYYVNIIVSALLIYFGYELFKSEHLKYEKELNDRQEQVKIQNEELSDMQKQLQTLLDSRTKQLESQNQDMIKYAYLNAHKVRSSLARILGLVNLTKYEDLGDEPTRKYYFTELKSNATDLDKVIAEINQILNKNLSDN